MAGQLSSTVVSIYHMYWNEDTISRGYLYNLKVMVAPSYAYCSKILLHFCSNLCTQRAVTECRWLSAVHKMKFLQLGQWA